MNFDNDDEIIEYIKKFPTENKWQFSRLKKHKPLLSRIKYITNFLPDDASWPQRLYHIENDLYQIPHCEYCYNNTNWKADRRNYSRFCSNRCSSRSNSTIELRKETTESRYGEKHYVHTDEYKVKARTTNLKKFGKEFASQTSAFQEKVKETCMSRYGITNGFLRGADTRYNKDEIHKHHTFQDKSAELIEAIFDRDWLYTQHVVEKKSLTEIAMMLGNYNISSVSRRTKRFGIPIVTHYTSIGENEIGMFLSKHNITYTAPDRKVIYPSEIDILVNDHMLGIEYHGLFWHNEFGVSNNYHSNKHNMCQKKGIRLIQIFEHEWLEKEKLIKEKILNIVGQSTSPTVYARKCNIIEVSKKEKRNFFEANHIQGDGPSSINYGLEHDGELVAVIGFIKQKDHFVLNRFATSCNVPGGFTRLLKHFEREHNTPKIITFADLRWSEGDLYKNTGFALDKELSPDYYWCKNKKVYHKFNFRHTSGLKKLENYDPNLSEVENMHNHGFYRIYDAGKLRFTKNY